MDRDLWPAPIFSPRFTDFRSFCAVSYFYQNGGPGNKFWTRNSKFQRHHIKKKTIWSFKAVSSWRKRCFRRIAHWLWLKFDLLASVTSVKFYELRRNIQRPTLVCARHFAIKCFDSRSNFNDEKGNTECLCFKRRSVEWRRWSRRSKAECASWIVAKCNIRPHFYASLGRGGQ